MCTQCARARMALTRRKYKAKLTVAATRRKSSQIKTFRQKHRRMKIQLVNLKERLKKMRKQNQELKEDTFQERIMDLPTNQQQAALHFFRASRRKSTRGMDFTQDWVLECIIMDIKSPKLYRHMRKNKILVLPCKDTLRKYLASYKTSFGFCTKVLSALKEVTKTLDSFKLHGGLLVDEIKLSEHLSVTPSARIDGFVNLGRFMPYSQRHEPCDHGMLIMFCPFAGKWTQILAVFATHGNVEGELLAKIVIEAVILAEDAGLLVDFVTC